MQIDSLIDEAVGAVQVGVRARNRIGEVGKMRHAVKQIDVL